MKKRYAMIMAAAVFTGVMTATAMAEGTDPNGGMQMGGPRMSGPQMPGGSEMNQAPTFGRNDQMPGRNGGRAPQGKPMNDNGMRRDKQMNDRRPEGGADEFKRYVDDGTISRETYDAITKYMEENKPDLLKDLLENNVITQEEYDSLVAAREADKPAAPPAETQNSDSTPPADENSPAADESAGA